MKQQVLKRLVIVAMMTGVVSAASAAGTVHSIVAMPVTPAADIVASRVVTTPVVSTVSADTPVDLTLEKAVQMALDYNRSIKIAQHDLEQAEFDVSYASSGKMPTVGYTFSGAREKTDSTSSKVVGNTFSNDLALTLPVYTGGEVEGQIGEARYARESAREGVLLAEESTKLSAITDYYDLLYKANLSDVDKESVNNLSDHTKNVQAKYAVGTVAKLDVLTSQVSLANAKKTAISADNDVSIAEATLNTILGLPLQTKLNVADHRLPFSPYNISLDNAIAYALEHHPEVRQADYAVKKAEESVTVANSGNLPTVSVSAGRSIGSTQYYGNDETHKGWSVGADVTFSVFDGGATKAKVGAAKSAVSAYIETAQQKRDSISLAVKQAYLNVYSAAERVRATQTAVAEAEESFNIASVRYRAGVGINLDVLDAQLDLNQAKTNYVQALYDYNVGIATLENAMGVNVKESAQGVMKSNV